MISSLTLVWGSLKAMLASNRKTLWFSLLSALQQSRKWECHQMLPSLGLYSSQVHETFLPPGPRKCGWGCLRDLAALPIQPPDQKLKLGGLWARRGLQLCLVWSAANI